MSSAANRDPADRPADVAANGQNLGLSQHRHDLEDSGRDGRAGEGGAQRLGDLAQLQALPPRQSLRTAASSAGRRPVGFGQPSRASAARCAARLPGVRSFAAFSSIGQGPRPDIEQGVVGELLERLGPGLQPLHPGGEPASAALSGTAPSRLAIRGSTREARRPLSAALM